MAARGLSLAGARQENPGKALAFVLLKRSHLHFDAVAAKVLLEHLLQVVLVDGRCWKKARAGLVALAQAQCRAEKEPPRAYQTRNVATETGPNRPVRSGRLRAVRAEHDRELAAKLVTERIAQVCVRRQETRDFFAQQKHSRIDLGSAGVDSGLAKQRVADESRPIVSIWLSLSKAFDLRQVRRDVVGEVNRGRARRGQKDVVQRGAAAEAQHGASGRRAKLFDEVLERTPLVLLQLAVVFSQVVARHPRFECTSIGHFPSLRT